MAELRPYNPTLRERTKQYIAGALTNLGMDNYRAQKTARGFTGSTRPDLNMAEASGVLEFTPVGLAFGLDESYRGLQSAQTPVDYAIEGTIGAVTLGEAVAKAYPFTAQTIKFLRSLKSKNKSIAEEIVDDQKRETLKTMGKGALATVAAEPLIGALGNVPKSTVAKKVVKSIPKDAFKIPLFNQAMNKELAKNILSGKMGARLKKIGESNIDEAIMEIDTDQELKVMRDSYNWFRGGKKGDAPNDFAKQLDAEYPDADSNEIANVIGDSNQAGGDVWQETQLFKNPDKKEIAKAVRDKTYNWDLVETNKPDGFDQLSPKQQDLIFSMGVNEAPQSWIAENTASLLESGITAYGKKVK